MKTFVQRMKHASPLVPIALLIVGIGIAIGGAIRIVRASSSDGFRFEALGETLVSINKPGEYRLWIETRSIIDGSFHSFPDTLPPGSTITVFQMPEQELVEQRLSGNMRMTVNGVKRTALVDMTLPKAGDYRIVLSGMEEKRFFYLDEASSVLPFFKGVGTAMLGVLVILGGAFWGMILLTSRAGR